MQNAFSPIYLPGALAGMGGSAAMLGVIVFVALAIGIAPETGSVAELERFGRILPLRIVENALYASALVLWLCHGLALGGALWRAAPAAALFGTGTLTLGLAIMTAGAVPHLAHLAVWTDWQAGDPTAATLWRAVWGLFDALLVTGFTIAALGMLILGGALWRAGGRRAGPVCTLLGLTAVLAAPVGWFDADSPLVGVVILSMTGFHLAAALWLRAVARHVQLPMAGAML